MFSGFCEKPNSSARGALQHFPLSRFFSTPIQRLIFVVNFVSNQQEFKQQQQQGEGQEEEEQQGEQQEKYLHHYQRHQHSWSPASSSSRLRPIPQNKDISNHLQKRNHPCHHHNHYHRNILRMEGGINILQFQR